MSDILLSDGSVVSKHTWHRMRDDAEVALIGLHGMDYWCSLESEQRSEEIDAFFERNHLPTKIIASDETSNDEFRRIVEAAKVKQQ